MNEQFHAYLADLRRRELESQRWFVNTQVLPTKMSTEDRMALRKAGVRFARKFEKDGQFQYVELPTGWKKIPENHPHWSYLVDDKGRRRAFICYCHVVSYDHIEFSTTPRYSYNCYYYYDKQAKEDVGVACIDDEGATFHKIEFEIYNQSEVNAMAKCAATAWLDANYPDWKDPNAYRD